MVENKNFKNAMKMTNCGKVNSQEKNGGGN